VATASSSKIEETGEASKLKVITVLVIMADIQYG
jgi:hypothetical protein